MKKLLALLCSVITSALFAALVVDPTVSDNCVLLQNAQNIVTGKTTAGRTVTVKLGGTQLGSATAGSDGAYTVSFNPGAASFTARTIEVSDGSETKSFGNILVGEVWLVSGQSNAQYWLSWKDFSALYPEWMNDVDYPNCRMYTILTTDSNGILDTKRCWKLFNSANAPMFSAIGFFFAKEIYKAQNVPVGIVVAAQGGSGINEWLTEETVQANNFTSGLSGTSRCASRVEPDSRLRTRGVLWYQGETEGFSSQGQTYYQNALPLLINQWRAKQENPNYPVLLMSFPQSVSYDASEGRYPAIREAQEVVAKTVANVAKVPAIDLGSSNTEGFGKCLHPDDKEEAARRCYLAARNLVYGESSFRYRCPQPAKAMWNADKTEARVIMPSDTVLNWTNETQVAYSYLPFIFKDASGNAVRYSPSPSVSLSADGRVILCKVNGAAVNVGYCQKLENSKPMETQIVDQEGYPLPAFREFPISNYEQHTHAYGPVGYHWIGVTACTAGKSCTVCGEHQEEEGTVQVSENPTTHAQTGTATFANYPSTTRTLGAVQAHATLIVKGLAGNYGSPTPGYGTHTDMPLGVSYTATAPAGTFALPDGTTTSCTGHVFKVGTADPVTSAETSRTFTPEEDVTYTLTWLYSGAIHVHSYEPSEYRWTDVTDCRAIWACACGDSISEGANLITSEVTKTATCAPGERTYTAKFATLGTATKKVEIAPTMDHALGTPVYSWSGNYATCTAKATCSRDATHVVTESVTSVREVLTPATTEAKGRARYTATFTNTLFTVQTQEVDLPKVGAADYYVSTTGSDGNAGTSRDQAFKTIAKAVTTATAGKKICVLPGLYEVSSVVTVDKDVTIYGETEDPADVIVRNVAEGWADDVDEWLYKTGPERVFVLNSTGAVLSGLAVEGGKIGGTEAVGGNILINENGGTVTNCIIRNAKVHALYNGTAKSKAGGAGIACLSANGLVTHCVITNNFLTRGNVSGNDSLFTEGGSVGAHLTAGTIRQSLIAFNTTTNDKLASALWLKGGALAENCTIAGNRGLGTEGHFYPVAIVPNSVGTVRNCLIYGNTGVNGETALIDLTDIYSYFASKVPPCFVNCATDMTPLEGMTIVTTGITVANAAAGDFRPVEGSSLIDAGAEMTSSVSGDLLGNPRVSGSAVDIGCYEFGGANVPPVQPPHEHAYTTTNYTWAADYSACTARATCAGCSDFFEESGSLTTNRVAGSGTTPGSVTYTATFATLGSDSKTVSEPASPSDPADPAVPGGDSAQQALWPSLAVMPDWQANQVAAPAEVVAAAGFNANDYRMPYLEWSEAPANPTGACVIILPSGGNDGYNATSDRASLRPFEAQLLAKGVTCVWLWYRTPSATGLAAYKTAWEDGQRAIRLVRQAATEKGYSADKIGVMGAFSGAHLAVLLGASSQTAAYAKVDSVDDISCKLNFAIPMSPTGVLTDEAGTELDPIFTFDTDLCPMCVYHGELDTVASPIGTTRIYRQLRKYKDYRGFDPVPSEVHLYPELGHEYIDSSKFERALEFMFQMELLGELPAVEKIYDRLPVEHQASKFKYNIWPDGQTPDYNSQQEVPTITWHFPEERKTDAVIILYAGGGYNHNVTENNLTVGLRRYLNARGMTAVTLHYRTANNESLGIPRSEKYVRPWQDLQRAVRLVRRDAQKFGLNPQNIGVSGFSAGGHLSLLGAVSSQTAAYARVDEVDDLPCNIQWAIPFCPAYVLSDGWDSVNCGADQTVYSYGNADWATIMPEFKFDEKSCPVLFLHGDLDWYSCMASIKCWEALRAIGVNSEVHTLAKAPHDFPNANCVPGTASYTCFDRIWEFVQRRATFADVVPSVDGVLQPSGHAYCFTDAKILQNAIDAAVPNGTVTLGEGTFSLVGDLAVTGGVKLVGQGWQKTVLTRTTADYASPTTYRLVTVDGGAKVEGVTITGGKACEAAGSGAVLIKNGTVSGCCITNNIGSAHSICGVGVSFLGGQGTLDHSIVVDNIVSSSGASALNQRGTAIGIKDTVGPVTVDTCLVVNNGLSGNTAGHGGIYLDALGGECQIRNCTITGNRSVNDKSGGICVNGTGTKNLVLVNDIVAGNTMNADGAEGNLFSNYSYINPDKSSNCLFGKESELKFNSGAMYTMANSVSGDPLFVNAAAGDYHLQASSPAMEAGAVRTDGATDLDGRSFNVTKPAIGCYEVNPSAQHEHVYVTTNYTWTADFSACTAKASCGQCTYFFEEPGTITTNRVAGDCTTPGSVTYTATFATLGSDSKTVELAQDHAWGEASYSWNTQDWTCTATAVCTRNASHATNETATATYSVVTQPKVGVAGLGRYTATFANSLFTAQTYEVDIPAKEDAGTAMVADYYVSPDSSVGSDTNSGTREQPFATIAHAVSVAQEGETICLLSGTHLVTSTTAANVSGTAVSIAKGITIVGETGDPADVVVRNVATGWSDDFTKYYYCYARVFEINNEGAVLSGIAVEEGKIGGTDTQGGNILINTNGGTVTNCIIRNAKMHAYWGGAKNKASGAGIACLSAKGLITHCVITNNLASRKSTACVFGNVSQPGGAAGAHLTAGVIRDSLIAYNATTNDNTGTAIYIGGAGTLMENCTIAANRGLGSEGTFYPVLLYPSASESNNPLIRNTLIVGGSSSDLFAEVWTTQYASSLTTAGKRFVNCATDYTVPTTGFGSLITSGIKLTGDFHPTAGSSVIDAGAAMTSPVELDLAGNTRVVNDIIDIGCYEFGTVQPPAEEWDIPGTQGGIKGMDNGKGGKCVAIKSISIVNGSLSVGFEAGEVDANGQSFTLICKEHLTDTTTFTINVTLANGAESTVGSLAGFTDKAQLFILGIGPANK